MRWAPGFQPDGSLRRSVQLDMQLNFLYSNPQADGCAPCFRVVDMGNHGRRRMRTSSPCLCAPAIQFQHCPTLPESSQHLSRIFHPRKIATPHVFCRGSCRGNLSSFRCPHPCICCPRFEAQRHSGPKNSCLTVRSRKPPLTLKSISMIRRFKTFRCCVFHGYDLRPSNS